MVKEKIFNNWFPLTISFDLIEGNVNDISDSIIKELNRIVPNESIIQEFKKYDSINDLFYSLNILTNIPTKFYLIPTKSKWAVLWNNSFLCSGYDSLMYMLSNKYNLKTIHCYLSEKQGIFSEGYNFTYREKKNNELKERYIYCAKEGSIWKFFQKGEPLKNENVDLYTNRIKKKRLNENIMIDLLIKLGANPWSESFYDYSKKICLIERTKYPNTISKKKIKEIVGSQEAT